MIQTIEQEITTTVQAIKKNYSARKFEHKLGSVINNYLKNSDTISYFEMRNQLDLDFNLDMNPIFIYIINDISIIHPDINLYIKAIEKIRVHYGSILHYSHEAAINPMVAENSSGMGYLKPATAYKNGSIKYCSNVIPLTKDGKKGQRENSSINQGQNIGYRDNKFICDTVKTM